TGPPGPPGPTGPTGPTGSTGPTGPSGDPFGGGTFSGSITVNGTVTATSFTATSDVDAKSNLQRTTDALEKVRALNGYTYTMKHDGQRYGGLIAQEVERVLPEAVKVSNGSKYLDYNATIALLVNAVKELSKRLKKFEE
ncbi:MAG TPA: hypothetical protein DCM40_13740, partial [Maribacter sp.]|nr:hypothetical protein [Maribacter sp.]